MSFRLYQTFHVRKACESSIFLFHGLFPFATKCKKKGVKRLCCHSLVSPNTSIQTTAKPTPRKVQAFAFHCCWILFEFGDFRSTQSRSKHFLYVTMSMLNFMSYIFLFCYTFIILSRKGTLVSVPLMVQCHAPQHSKAYPFLLDSNRERYDAACLLSVSKAWQDDFP